MENTTKFTKTQLIIGAIVLVLILAFVFFNKSSTDQAQNLQQPKSETSQVKDNSTYRDQLVSELMGENEQLSESDVSLFGCCEFCAWSVDDLLKKTKAKISTRTIAPIISCVFVTFVVFSILF